jgi:hypothetical protein
MECRSARLTIIDDFDDNYTPLIEFFFSETTTEIHGWTVQVNKVLDLIEY